MHIYTKERQVCYMKTEKRRAFIINAMYYLIFAVAAVLLLKYGLPLLMPFVLGFVFAYFLRKPVAALQQVLRTNSKIPAIIVVAAFYVAIGTLLSFISIKSASGIENMINGLPGFYSGHVEPLIISLFTRLEELALKVNVNIFHLISEWENQIMSTMGKLVSSLSMTAMTAITGIAASLPGFFIKVLLMIISTFFIAADYKKITGFCLDQLSGRGKEIYPQIKEYLIGTLFVCIRSYLLIMFITFVELSAGLSFIGIKNAVAVAAFIAVFDILPVLGTGGIMIPWGVISLLSGQVPLGLKLLAVYLVITVIRNIIEPKIVGSQLGLHPVVTLASMFAGVHLFGVIGLFGFPIGLSLMCYLNDNGVIHVFNKKENTAA